MSASQQDQDSAINAIAAAVDNPGAADPIGRPNIYNICRSDPAAKLGHVISEIH